MSVGEQIRFFRNKQGLTQTQLSDRSGVPQTTISNLESKGTDPTGTTLKKLAPILGATTDELLNIKEVTK
ncbi:helix-turn-helix domain-containing protein [Lentilactobacillus hilgardii]|uniref:helix-turn-helix domain-containing protein n=1 Tax=Lentilactobacillus hilgardii TaxID=1588 RepID=UPI0021A667A1|nr:helix-turn-helix transcriptional regulator [Lentilactobacillus hilgardii]MCT3395900.1 XRE family transcriptional regulator [Lentilactobacillus hilgardii]